MKISSTRHYAIQVVIPAKQTLTGQEDSCAIKLPDGRTYTDNLEYARLCYQMAQQNLKARLVMIQTVVVDDTEALPAAAIEGIQVNWQAAEVFINNRAGKRGRTGFSFPEEKQCQNLPLTDTAITWLNQIADQAGVNRNDVIELWSRELMSFPTIGVDEQQPSTQARTP